MVENLTQNVKKLVTRLRMCDMQATPGFTRDS